MLTKYTQQKSFTLIELLVVIAIIGLLSSIVLVSTQGVRAKARDSRRLQDMRQIITALQLYNDKYERYPDISADGCCNSWDQGPCGSDTTFIGALVTEGFMATVPTDPIGGSGTDCYGYGYYYYNCTDGGAGYPCYGCTQPYFVLGIRDMETSGNPHPDSPGWSCSGRDWHAEFEWVIGGFE